MADLQVRQRKKHMDSIFEVGLRLKLSALTVHHALRLFDIMISTSWADDILAMTCLLVASKYTEHDKNLPYIDDIVKTSKMKLTTHQFVSCEKRLMK